MNKKHTTFLDHTQDDYDYAYRSPGSWVPDRVERNNLARKNGETVIGAANPVSPYMDIYLCGSETNHTECHLRHPDSDVRGKS